MGDEEGEMNVSARGIVKRDELVFEVAKQNKVPVCMLLSGGYTKRSAKVIGYSLINLINRFYIDCGTGKMMFYSLNKNRFFSEEEKYMQAHMLKGEG